MYPHKDIEKKWQEFWKNNQTFRTDDSDNKEKRYILDMFPYPSADGLHVGHPEGYTATDIYSRYLRMKGYNVLHPMGWDAFGLPAENFAIKKGIHPQETTQASIANFRRQIQSLGFSYDWDREIDTSSPEYYKWTQWLFLELYKKGLAYKAKAPVNWCEHCQTVLANEQVINGTCERCKNPVIQKLLEQWFFKVTEYADELISGLDNLDWPESIKTTQRNWIGKSDGATITFSIKNTSVEIPVFTTRPDTLFGVSALMLAPEHPALTEFNIKNRDEVNAYIETSKHKTNLERTFLSKEKTGVCLDDIKAINPANSQEIPVFVADYVLGSYGTGAVMSVPAHDQRDWEFAKKYNLPIVDVVMPTVTDQTNPPREDKQIKIRNVVHAIVYDPRNKKYLTLRGKPFNWNTVVIGGIEEGETALEAALRELKEETGYIDVKYIKTLGGPIQAHFFAKHKDENRIANTTGIYFELASDERVPVSEEEQAKNDVLWTDEKDFTTKEMVNSELPFWLERMHSTNDAYSGEGILINSEEFDGTTTKEASSAITQKVNGKITSTYRLRDWLVSRQRYWGAPIPIIYCETCGTVPVPEIDLPVLLPTDVDFRPTGESPLVRSKTFHDVKCPQCDSPARRESDTMDTFVCSSWYYLRYVSPHNNDSAFDQSEAKSWLPVDICVGGAEHAVLHLMYARFITKALKDMGYVQFDEPFIKLRNQGMILGEDGEKMSKSRGNVINPDIIINEYGADTFRLYEMFMGPLGDAKPWNTQSIAGSQRFLDKVWSLYQTALESNIPEKETNSESLKNIHKAIKKITADIETMSFNTAISTMMICVNALQKEQTAGHTLGRDTLESFTKLLSPFAPHIAEELWEILGNKEGISFTPWPAFDETLIRDEMITIAVQINGKTRTQLSVSHDLSEEEIQTLAFGDTNVKKWIEGRETQKVIYIPARLLNIVTK